MKTTILVLAANPSSTARLRLDKEVRDIKAGLKRAKHRDQFELFAEGAVRDEDLEQAMLDYSPNIIHFCGHGHGEAGIVLEDNEGNPFLVPNNALADLFSLFNEDHPIDCVLLNACYSAIQAEAIVQHIPYVIGMSKAIGDQAAIKFAVSFYNAIGSGRSIEFAYKLGCNAIKRAGIDEHLTPILKKQGGAGSSATANVASLTPSKVPSVNTHNTFAELKNTELNKRWQRLTKKIDLLQESYDNETRIEEKLRISVILEKTISDREKVEKDM